MRIMRFFPALVFLLFWALVVNRGLEIKKAMQEPVTSNQFISAIGRGIDNPWTRNSALRVFFVRLRETGAPARVWVDSQPYAWALWNEDQYVGGIEIMLLIAHKSGNRVEERYWARKYAAMEPNNWKVRQVLKQAFSSQPSSAPLFLLGKW